MSLYVGHFSPHIRGEELERVFRRFGPCSLQMKDGYAFIVYEVTADAAKALRALRGTIICGEKLSLNWSNRQPRPFHARHIDYEPYRRRNLRGEQKGVRFRDSLVRRDFAGASRVRLPSRERLHLDDVLDKEICKNSEDVNGIGVGIGSSVKDKLIDVGGPNELSLEENDRWGEPASDALTGCGEEDDSDFNRYEPYRGYIRRDEKEYYQRASPYGFREQESSPERGKREPLFDGIGRNFDSSKPSFSCFNCGFAGHIMRNCPHGDTRREKFSKFNPRRGETHFRVKGEERVKRFRPNSWGRPNLDRDTSKSRHHTRDKKESHFERARRVEKNEPSKKIRSCSRADYHRKRKRKPENGTPKRPLKKRKARRFVTSSSSSDSSTDSGSRSKSLRSSSASSSCSYSKSISTSFRSTSSSSRSPGSSYQKSQSSRSSSKTRSRSMTRSRSKSRSRSSSMPSFLRSWSLSVSSDQKPPLFRRRVPTNVFTSASPKGNLDHVPSFESKPPLAKETSDPIGKCSTMKDAKVCTPLKVDGEPNGEHPGKVHDEVLYSTDKVGDMETNAVVNRLIDCDVNFENQGKVDVISENQGDEFELQGDVDPELNRQFLPRSEASCSTKISSQEMLLALNHYGLPTPQEGESDISVEAYFGAARMWPWELIYYRRLKKGPISTENYARRLKQNQEFGIVDKYIRSSSGWGESHASDS